MDQQNLEQARRRFMNLDERIVESLSTLLHRREAPAPYRRRDVSPTWDPNEQREAFDQAIAELEQARAELRRLHEE